MFSSEALLEASYVPKQHVPLNTLDKASGFNDIKMKHKVGKSKDWVQMGGRTSLQPKLNGQASKRTWHVQVKVAYSCIHTAINELYGKLVWFSLIFSSRWLLFHSPLKSWWFCCKLQQHPTTSLDLHVLTLAQFPTRAKILVSWVTAPDLKHQNFMLPLNDGMIQAADPSANRFLPMMGGFRCRLSLSGGGWWMWNI